MKKILLALFLAVASLSNAQINSPIGVDEPLSSPTGNSNEVGVTNGNLSVSLTGAATYSIPIAVPPGINGVVPQVSLNYNSQGGNGLAGYGWNISGLSVITRIPSTKYHDNISDPIDFDSHDRFAYDGQRLILKSGTHGGVGSVYETETFSNLRISGYGTHFVVEYPDGSIAVYGNSADSKSLTTWAITYWQNPQGLRINYNYTLTENNLNITSIKYGSVGATQTLNEILFVYKNRARNEQGYLSGQNIMNKKILSNIIVNGNGVGYRNYILEHTITDLGYEKLIKITEKSGDNSVALNPTVFEYGDDNQSMLNTGLGFGLDKSFAFDKFNAINGDFDGDGSDDYLLLRKAIAPVEDWNKIWLYKNVGVGTNTAVQFQIQGNRKVETLFPSTILTGTTGSYKIKPEQAFTVVSAKSTSDVFNTTTTQTIYFDTYGLSSNTIVLDQTKNIVFPCDDYNDLPKYDKKFLAGDFNGDGITDNVMIIGTRDNPINNGTTGNCASIARDVYFIDLKKDVITNYNKYCGKIPVVNPTFFNASENNKITKDTDIQVLDFNGDGKSDFVIFDYNGIRVFTFNSTFDGLIQLCHINTLTFNDYGLSHQQKFIGDFNGDGKSDIVFPTSLNNTGNWTFCVSNGLTFVSFIKNLGINYDRYRKQYVEYQYNGNNVNVSGTVTKETYLTEETIFFVKDFNGDGKSDIMFQKHIFKDLVRSRYVDWQGNLTEFATDTYETGQTREKFLKLFGNKNIATNDITFNPPVTTILPSSSLGAIPLMTNINKIDFFNLDYTYIVGNQIFSIGSARNHVTDLMLRKITIGNGVSESITYKGLIQESSSPLTIYSYINPIENYPNFDVKNATSLKVVSMLERQSATVYNKKLFAYHGAVTNFNGLGFLGFRATMQTNWFNDDAKIISSVSKFNIGLRGANTESYNVLGLVAPTNSYSSTTFIGKTVNTYNTDALQANKVFKLKTLSAQQFNGLDNTSSSVVKLYNIYNNPTVIYTTNSNGTITEYGTTTNFVYDAPLSSPYIIDRPKSKATTQQINFETLNSEEVYTYNSNLLKQIKKKGHNTNYVTEDYEHDIYGNITKKTLSATGMTNRVTAFEYDASSHRFIIKKTDIEGLITQYSYNQATGTVSSETLPSNAGYPLITNFEYDKWGKQTKVTDFLGKELTYIYENITNGGIKLTTNRSDNSSEIVISDDLGRKVHEGSNLIDNNWSYVSTVYDSDNRPVVKSQPYLGSLGLGNYAVWNEMKYDVYGRVIEAIALKSSSSPGKISTYTYSGLTTTEADNFKSKQTTKNAIGQIIALTDTPGGTITYSYYANGNLKQTNFGGVITTIEQDGWGRKTKLIDPSAGTYQYQYNEFGQATKEIAPKGETTYTFDAFGKVTQKTIIGLNGDPTNSKTVYTYDATTKLLTNVRYDDFTGGFFTLYGYGYDNYKRLNFSDESGFNAYYQRATQFDSFGRPEKELFTAINTSDGKRSDKWLRNSYKNGLPWQIIDDATNAVLWQTNNTNASGKLLSGNYGNGISVSNTYDTFGFPQYINHDSSTNNIMYLETVFEPIRGNLTERVNGLFGFFTEDFQYDSLDRLSTYMDKNDTSATQTYDNLGRINTNPIGQYNYEVSGKAFQNSSVTLTPEANVYYQSRSALDITYNSFKSPIDIIEAGKDKLSFIYNMNNSRSTMYYGGLQDDKYLRPLRKHYSADGSMEIKQNIATGDTEFITYIVGDAYSAPVILKSDGTTQQYYYLHRDYQSSIVAITDQAGAIVEKRRFDVWGNIVEVQDGAGNNLSKLTFIDRGYTGHEHLQGVVLIHMNARLYDPVVHRFLQPDNNVQDPYNAQNYNRYSYVMNNPTKFTDPTGEFWSFVVSFLFNAYANGVQSSGGQLNPFKWNSAAWINAGLGGASAGISMGASNYLNSYVDNYGKSDKPKDFGGENPIEEHGFACCNIKSFKPFTNFGSESYSQKYSNTNQMNTDYYTLTNKRDNLSIKQIEDILNTEIVLATNENLPSGYSIAENGLIVYSGGTAGGITVPYNGDGLKSKIYMAPGLKDFPSMIRVMCFKHEFMHAWHLNKGLSNYNKYSERATSTYSVVFVRAFNLKGYEQIWFKNIEPYPSNYSWKEFNKIIPLWIK